MKKVFSMLLVSMAILAGTVLLCAAESGQEEKGRAYYDFGVFAFEEEDYSAAENHLKIALEFSPGNPYYNHCLGKVYLQTGRYEDAGMYLDRAWKISPDTAGLTFDRALLAFRTEDFAEAATLFARISEAEDDHVLAAYYAGISYFRLQEYEQAVPFFLSSAEKSPTLRANAFYHAGICFQKTGDAGRAVEMFEYVKDDPEAGILRDSAIQWIEILKQQTDRLRPYRLFLKFGAMYDDNVQLMPDDDDIAGDLNIVADESDIAMQFQFSGSYDFLIRNNYKMGLGFSQYNTWYSDLDAYDLSGSSGHFYGAYYLNPFSFRLNYFPTYYLAGSDSYLRQHRLEPEMIWHISNRLATRLSYRYKDNTYFEDKGRSGHANELFGDIVWSLLNGKAQIFGGMGYEDYSASREEEYYTRWRARGGASLKMPWEVNLGLSGEYQSRDYDNPDSFYNVQREDDKYIFAVNLSRKLWTEWLGVMAEYRHTENASNIRTYEYSRNVSTVSLTLSY